MSVRRRGRSVAPAIELFPGCGHDISLVQAERFNRRVLEFLEGRLEPPVQAGY